MKKSVAQPAPHIENAVLTKMKSTVLMKKGTVYSGRSAVSQPHIKLDITKSFVFGLLSQKL